MRQGQIPYAGQQVSDANEPQSVQLKSGQIWIVPVGTLLLKLGSQSALQFFDGNAGVWRLWDSGPSNSPIEVTSDGTNFRVINVSGTIDGVNITNAGTAYAASTTMTFAAPAAGITALGFPIIGGKLTLAITTAGTGYVNPTLIIPPPQNLGGTAGACLPATANLSLTTGTITSASLGYSGAGYGVAPNANLTTYTPAQIATNPDILLNNAQGLILVDPAGTGAVITPTLAGAGTITGAVITNPGSGYDGTHIPAVTFTDPTGAGSAGAGTALPNMALTSVTVGGTNTGYTSSVVGITSLGNGTALATLQGEPVQPRAGRFVVAQSGGVLGTPVIEDAGNGFQTVPLAKQIGNATSDGSVNATFVAVVGGVTNTLIYWQIG